MSTYPQGVSQYIPQIQPYQPDYNFLSQSLQQKQSQYDQNWKSLNKVYGQYFYADVTHEDSKKNKDQLINQIEFNLGRVTGLDLSLEQNVQQAMQVFKPFYEDSNLMYDMAWTKNTANQKGVGEGKRNSTDPKTNEQYWGDGIKFIDYKIDEFKNSSYDKIRSIGEVRYTPYVNVGKMAEELAKDAKLMLPTVSFSDGFIIKQMNGQPLIEPLADLFSSVLGKDPRVKEVYDVQAYVDRKDTAYANKDKYNGDILASETAYLNESLKTLKTQTNNSFRSLESNGAAYTKTIETLEKSIADGTATPDTQASLDNYKSALSNNNNLLERTKEDLNLLGESVNKTENTKGGTLKNDDLESLRYRVDKSMANLYLDQDLQKAAETLSNMNADYDITANPFVVNERKHAQNMAEIGYRSKEAQKLAILKDMLENGSGVGGTNGTGALTEKEAKATGAFELTEDGTYQKRSDINDVKAKKDVTGGGRSTTGLDPSKALKRTDAVLADDAGVYIKGVTDVVDKYVADGLMTKADRTKILGSSTINLFGKEGFMHDMIVKGGGKTSFTFDNKVDLGNLKQTTDRLFEWAQKNKATPGVRNNSILQALNNNYSNIEDLSIAKQGVAQNKKDIKDESITKLKVEGYKYADEMFNPDGSERTKDQWIKAVTKKYPNDLGLARIPDYAELLGAGFLATNTYWLLNNFSKGPASIKNFITSKRTGKAIPKAFTSALTQSKGFGKYKIPAAAAAFGVGMLSDLFANGATAAWNYVTGDGASNISLKNGQNSGILSGKNNLTDEYNEMTGSLEAAINESRIMTSVAGIYGKQGRGIASSGPSTISVDSGVKLFNDGFRLFTEASNIIKNLDLGKVSNFSFNGVGTGALLNETNNINGSALLNQIINDAQDKTSGLGLFEMEVDPVAMGDIDKAAITFRPPKAWWDKIKPTEKEQGGLFGSDEDRSDSKWYIYGDDAPITPLDRWNAAQINGLSFITDASNLSSFGLFKHSVQSPMEQAIIYKGSRTYKDGVDPDNFYTTFNETDQEGIYNRTDTYLMWNKESGKDVKVQETIYGLKGDDLEVSKNDFYTNTLPQYKAYREVQFQQGQ